MNRRISCLEPRGCPTGVCGVDGECRLRRLALQRPANDLTHPTKDRMPTVYLIAQPTVRRQGGAPDLTPLAKFGEVRVLVLSGEYPTYNASQVLEKMDKRLDSFDPHQDFLVWAGGDTLAAFMVGALLANRFAEDRTITHFTWLRFERDRRADGSRDNERGEYVPIRVPLFLPSADVANVGAQQSLAGA